MYKDSPNNKYTLVSFKYKSTDGQTIGSIVTAPYSVTIQVMYVPEIYLFNYGSNIKLVGYPTLADRMQPGRLFGYSNIQPDSRY